MFNLNLWGLKSVLTSPLQNMLVESERSAVFEIGKIDYFVLDIVF